VSGLNWTSVDTLLPVDGQAVLVRRRDDNWSLPHLIADYDHDELVKAVTWRWVACKFVRGRTSVEVDKSTTISSEDQHGSNLKPYIWKMFGSSYLFGQDVTHWAEINDPELGT
jgi:hypothetical protein